MKLLSTCVIFLLFYLPSHGQTRLYTKDKKLSKEGYFVDGKLQTGKVYLYDEAGSLYKIVLYMDGVKIRDSTVTKIPEPIVLIEYFSTDSVLIEYEQGIYHIKSLKSRTTTIVIKNEKEHELKRTELETGKRTMLSLDQYGRGVYLMEVHVGDKIVMANKIFKE